MEYAKKFFQVDDINKLNEIQRSEGLTRFYINEIYNVIHTPISEDDVDTGIVDGKNDLGIDFFYRDDKTVLIIQTKYTSWHKSIDAEDITYFQKIFERMSNDNLNVNSKLQDAMRDIDIKRDKFLLKFITLGDISGATRILSESDIVLPMDLSDRVEFEYLDATELNIQLRTSQSVAFGMPEEYTLYAAGSTRRRTPVIELENAPYPSCVLVVEAKHIVNLYQQYKDRLFTLNIRNFLGSTSTNKLLKNTLETEPEHFFYYNNGISCLAKKIEILDDRVNTFGLQVINGAQTVRSLAKVAGFTRNRVDLTDVLVLVRITQADKNYATEGRFQTNMVRFNNTQNVVRASDFRSNDPVHESIKKQFEDYKRNGKKVVYLSKRTDSASRHGNEVILLEEYAKSVYSFLKDPVSFSSSTAFLFDDTDNGGYKYIFGDGLDIWISMPTDEFKLRSAIWWLSQAFSRQLRTDKQNTDDNVEKNALERKWMLLYAARLVLDRSYRDQDYKKDFIRTYKGDWYFGDGKVGDWLHLLYDISKEVIIYQYSEAHKRPGFVHRNWMRSETTVESIKDYIERALIRRMPELPIPNL